MIFSLHHVFVSYTIQGEEKKVLQDVNFSLQEGQKIGLYGPNGCGKTTFFRCITGLVKPTQGNIFFQGKMCQSESDFVRLRQEVGFAVQQAEDQIFFPTVLEDVAFGPLNLGLPPKEAYEIAKETLSQLGMDSFSERLVHQLSAGEKRLIALAGILAMKPKALLLDEPTTGLDTKATTRLTKLLQELSCAQIIVSHDWAFMQSVCQTYFTIDQASLVRLEHGVIHTHTHIHPLGNYQHEH